MHYGSECWAINKADIQQIDAVDQWCLRRILDIRWHDCQKCQHLSHYQPVSGHINAGQLIAGQLNADS